MARRTLPPPKTGLWSGAHKLVLGTITTAAAFMTLMLNAKALGVSSFLGIIEPNVADHAARRIVLTPRTDTLRAIGDTAVIVATVTDARGATLAGASLRWRSSDSTVASVDSGGTIVARAPGRATVEVRVREVFASASILVRQQPDRLVLVGDSLVDLSAGDTARVAAVAVDAKGHRIRGLSPRWESSDTSVAVIDSAGLALSRNAGTAQLVAVLGEHRAMATLRAVLRPAEIVVLQGEAQRAPAGRTLAVPVVLQVRSRSGEPVPDVDLTFETDDAEAVLAPSTGRSDAHGRVRTTWTLGRRAGVQRLRARVASLDVPLTVTADADPVAKDTRVEVLSEALAGTVASKLERPVALRVTDSSGVALAGVRVTWTPLDGGTIEGAATTDSVGYAYASWWLGPRAGAQRLRVQFGDARVLPAHTLRATASPSVPAAVALSLAKPGAKGTRDVIAKVTDAHGNPVADQTLRFASTIGSLSATEGVADSLGRARVTWSPPTTPAAKSAARVIRAALADSKIATQIKLP
ncbi:MAG: Ig-like domain-containing protein [Gemmatimonadaceae bacterium]|nr:Ig-like domain-containing protein [Gemmatimonadaceae bacterium]